MLFSELPLHDVFRRALDDRGYATATPVQHQILDASCVGRDLLVSSRTGSGKTVAFGLAMAAAIVDDECRSIQPRRTRALVVAPTRELALQVARELSWLYRPTGARVTTCVGGMDFTREARMLRDGADIVVGTPGRLCDHLSRETMKLKDVAVTVLDEADEMLDMGFREELETLLGAAPVERRSLLFSATLPKEILRMAKNFTRDPLRVEATSSQESHQDITTIGHLVAAREREHAVVNVLRFHDVASALVFCSTRDGVSRLTANLVERGFSAVGLSGEMGQNERNRAVQAIRDGRARVLVGTDVAARGLDLPAVGLVIHGDLPHDAAILQHRSGRTGRAGRRGIAVILAPFPARRRAENLIRGAKIQGGWTPVPSSDDIRELDRERALLAVGALTTELSDEDLEEGRELLTRFSAESIAAALLRRERRAFPSAEELPMTLPPVRGRREPARPPAPRAAAESREPAEPRAPREPRATKNDDERPSKPPREERAAPAELTPRSFVDDDDTPIKRALHKPPAHKDDVARPVSDASGTDDGDDADVDVENELSRRERLKKDTEERRPKDASPRDDHDGPRSRDRDGPRGHDGPRDRDGPRAPRRGGDDDDGVWFKINVGSSKNADPRWLLPMICRRGNVTKRDVGRIEIEERDSFFMVARHAADAFSAASKKPDKIDANVKIMPASPARTPTGNRGQAGARDAENERRAAAPRRESGRSSTDRPRHPSSRPSASRPSTPRPSAAKGGPSAGAKPPKKKPHAPVAAKDGAPTKPSKNRLKKDKQKEKKRSIQSKDD